MENPLIKCNLFAAPNSVEELKEYLARFTGTEGVLAQTCALMAWNLASKIIDEEIAKRGDIAIALEELIDSCWHCGSMCRPTERALSFATITLHDYKEVK